MAGFSQEDPIISKLRSGKSGDEYVSISLESHKIINSRILLSEIPYKVDKVTITDSLNTVYSETTSTSPTSNQYYTNYTGDSAGVVIFNSDKEGRTVFATFKGKGLQYFPSARIAAEFTGTTVTKTLKDKLTSIDTTTSSLQTQITNNDQSRITDLNNHKNSTTAHNAANITFTGSGMGSTNAQTGIKEAWDRAGNIIASSGTSSSEVVDMRTVEAGYTPGRTITLAGDAIRDLQAKQKATVAVPLTIKRGLNSVNAPEGGKLDVKVKGITRVNLLGKDGNCEDTSKFSVASSSIVLDSSNAKYGTNAFKMTGNVAGSSFVYQNAFSKINTSKYYLLIASVKKLDAVDFAAFVDNGLSDNKYGNLISSTTYGDTYLKISPTYLSSATQLLVGVRLGATAIGQYGYVDGIRLYEIDSATYAKIDVDAEYTGDKLADKFPYVDGMKPLTTPYIAKSGKNLLPPFTEWTLHANAVANEPYKLTLNTTANYQLTSSPKINVVPSTACYLSVTPTGTGDIQFYASQYDKNGTFISNSALAPVSFTTASNCDHIIISAQNGATTSGVYTWGNPQLELGSVATVFEPQNNDYAYAISDSTGRPLALLSNIDGTVADEINFSTGIKFKRFEFMDADGSLPWVYHVDYTGFKTVKAPVTNLVTDKGYGVKNDGKILKTFPDATPNTGGDEVTFSSVAGTIYISISDTDSGWTEAMTPDSGDMKAYFHGWKMCASDGSAYVSGTKYWKKITDGTGITSTLPTASYTGYTPYKLQYQLATAVEESVTVEGIINLHSGLNQVGSYEGIISREKTNPSFSSVDNLYYINIKDGGSPNIPDGSKFKNRADKILVVYKNGAKDSKWSIKTSSSAHGNYYAEIKPADYDSTAVYTSDYTILDKYGYTSNVVDITASVPSTQKAVLETVVQQQADTATAVSVVQNNYARKSQGQWIAPVLLNAWVNYDSASWEVAGYMKDEFGFVHLKGLIKSGLTTSGLAIFTLPSGYRPKEKKMFSALSNNGTTDLIARIDIYTDGSVSIGNASNTYLQLSNISFRAEQ